jgi:multiple sugar transport system permease protein
MDTHRLSRKLVLKPGAAKQPRFSLAQREAAAGYAFLLPNFLGFLAFSLIPIVATLTLSVTKWNLLTTPAFVGAANYQQLVSDPLFWKTLSNSIAFTVGAVPIAIIIALFLALLLNRQVRGIGLFRTAFFIPFVTLTVAIAVVWSWIYEPNIGLLNYALSLIHIKGPDWLGSTTWAMPAIIIMSDWRGIGYPTLIFLAGLQTIPEEYYDAAKVDGAGWWQQLRYITVPLLSPTTFFVLTTSFIGTMQGFDQFYVMTQGGPAYATTTIVMYIYQHGFEWFNMGYAASLSVVLFLIILAITLVQWRLAREWVYGHPVREN